jgi:hypothetical protein
MDGQTLILSDSATNFANHLLGIELSPMTPLHFLHQYQFLSIATLD